MRRPGRSRVAGARLVPDLGVEQEDGGLVDVGARQVGDAPWRVIREFVDDAVVVSDDAIRAVLARYWARIGALEHASVASFARVSLQLLALGAPVEAVAPPHGRLAEAARARAAEGLAALPAATP